MVFEVISLLVALSFAHILARRTISLFGSGWDLGRISSKRRLSEVSIAWLGLGYTAEFITPGSVVGTCFLLNEKVFHPKAAVTNELIFFINPDIVKCRSEHISRHDRRVEAGHEVEL